LSCFSFFVFRFSFFLFFFYILFLGGGALKRRWLVVSARLVSALSPRRSTFDLAAAAAGTAA